jgi:hypothetical protein
MNNEDLLALLAVTSDKKAKPPKALKRWVMYAGSSEKHPWPKGASELIGTFQGNVGTTVRSRKGRTYHAPNGSRKYQVIGYQVINGETITAYKA